MSRQRKVVITVTYNEMGIIIDTKAEELDLSAQPEQPSFSRSHEDDHVADVGKMDCISRQAAIDEGSGT